MSTGRAQLSLPLAAALLVGVYVAAAGAVLVAPANVPAAVWWPAGGIAIALVGLAPRAWWLPLALGIVVATAAANATGGRPLDVSAAFGVANAAEAVVVAAVLRRGREQLPVLSGLDVFLRLLGAAVLGALTMATIAAAGVAALSDSSLPVIWWSVFVSHIASTLVIVPIVMAPNVPRRHGGWELPLQASVLAVITLGTFAPQQTLALDFVPLPVLLWAALRFDIRTVAWEVLGFAVATTFLTAHEFGPFGFDHRREAISSFGMGAVLQAYVLSAALTALPLAITIQQRRGLLHRVINSERLFRRNFTESLVGMLLLRDTGSQLLEIVDLNEAAARLLGGDRSPVGRSLADVLDTSESLELVAARMLAGNLDGWKAQTGLRDRRGARINVAVSLLSTHPEPMYSAQLLDVTAEYDALRRLEAAEKLTGATLDTTAAIILVTDLRGTIVRVNGAATALTGFTEAELVGLPVWKTSFAPADASDLEALFTWPNRSGAPVSRETLAQTRNGETLRVLWNSNVVRDEHDQPAYAVITGIDVTAERTAAGMNAHLLQAAITTALIGIDTQGRITVFNAGAENLLRYDTHEMVGHPFVDLLDPDELRERSNGAEGEAAFATLVAGIQTAGETSPRDWTWVGADGRRHIVSMTLSVAADAFAARVGYLCVGRDVTEARASQEMLVAALEKERVAVERLRQLDEAKNEFVSTVSHELRTPVTSIVGYTEILEDGSLVPPAPEQRPLLESIARNGQRLILLCNDLLTLSGLDADPTHWERETLDLTTVLPSAEEAIRPVLAGRDLALSFTTGPGPVLVLGDRVQLERVLTNLLGNAVKFTEDGGRIECRVEPRDDEAWLCVSDTGIGIPSEEQANLFQRFFRSSTAQERAIQGTGLGLSIVAAIVAAHGGRIDVRSAHLEGTTFTVRLPLARSGAVTRG